MLIHRIAAQLYTAEALQTVEAGLDAGEDVTLAVSQSGRTLMAAAQFARRPRPTVYIVSGEDAADRAACSLAAYVGLAHVCRFPERKDYPWREQAPDDAVVAQRCEALGRIVRGDNCIMVASARALLRCVPPVESRYWESTTFAVGEEIPLTRCRSAWWAWATPMPVPLMRPVCSAFTATPSRCFPRRKRRPCALSSLATRSIAYAAW